LNSIYNTEFKVVSEDVQVLWLLKYRSLIYHTTLCGSGGLGTAWFNLYDLRQILRIRALGCVRLTQRRHACQFGVT